jgi:hypothetical protein
VRLHDEALVALLWETSLTSEDEVLKKVYGPLRDSGALERTQNTETDDHAT